LRLVEGLTGPEIAQRTGLTPESVRVNLCRGMKLLRDEMADDRVHSAGRSRAGQGTQEAGPARGWPVPGAER
jgi:hypothetical protein